MNLSLQHTMLVFLLVGLVVWNLVIVLAAILTIPALPIRWQDFNPARNPARKACAAGFRIIILGTSSLHYHYHYYDVTVIL